jgi:poly(3-hydroxybutyrate) depolymerase
MRNYLRFILPLLAISGLLIRCKSVDSQVSPGYVCPLNRFITTQFTISTSTVTYGQANDYTGAAVTLQTDVNTPAGDTLALRPLIIYCHGGGFTSGTRTNSWAVKFCQGFAKRGYVTASIDYRLGLASNSNNDILSAQIRAVQDAKAAIRYFKQTAVEQGNPYRIDTAQIYISGESSGALIALQTAYLTSVSSFAEIADPLILAGLGGIEGNNPIAYSSNVAGVISMSGALLDLNWLSASTLPVISVHSSNDASVPYKHGLATPYTSTVAYGSFSVDSVASNTKVNSALYTFRNAGTAPYLTSTKYGDSTINYISQELVGLINCQRLGHR